jgi:predicted Zn-dependent protease
MMPSANDINCVMYQFQNVEELDKTGANFCDDQKAALKKVFISN